MATKHASKVFIPALGYKGYGRNAQPEELPKQARFMIRLAVACHKAGCQYDVNWSKAVDRMVMCLTASGNIPDAKPLPKGPKENPVATWRPNPYEAEYRLVAGRDVKGKELPGFVMAHSSGLALVRLGASESGQLESGENEARKVTEGWNLVHLDSLLPLGLGPLSLGKASAALLYAATLPVDWKLPNGEVQKHPNCRRASWDVLSQFAKSKHERERNALKLRNAAPYVAVEAPKPVKAPPIAPVPQKQRESVRLLPIQDAWGRISYIRYDPAIGAVA